MEITPILQKNGRGPTIAEVMRCASAVLDSVRAVTWCVSDVWPVAHGMVFYVLCDMGFFRLDLCDVLVSPWLLCSLQPLTYLCYPSQSACLHSLAPSFIPSLFIHSLLHLLSSTSGRWGEGAGDPTGTDFLPVWVCGFQQSRLLEGGVREHWLRCQLLPLLSLVQRTCPVWPQRVRQQASVQRGWPRPVLLSDRDLLASVRLPYRPSPVVP